MSIIIAIVFAFGSLICYASCCAASRADHQIEEYFYLKMQEKEAKKRRSEETNENLKNE